MSNFNNYLEMVNRIKPKRGMPEHRDKEGHPHTWFFDGDLKKMWKERIGDDIKHLEKDGNIDWEFYIKHIEKQHDMTFTQEQKANMIKFLKDEYERRKK